MPTNLQMGDRPYRILQLTDIHLGGGLFSRKLDRMALEAVDKLVQAAKADLIVITGDVAYPYWYAGASHNNLRAFRMVADTLARYDTPWTMVFGNHDTEPFARYDKEELGDFLQAQERCLFQKGPQDITGVGNYCLPLLRRDGSLCMALMFVDSNAYLGKLFFSGFDTIHDDQIEWYKRTIQELSPQEAPVPSLAFYHIPPKEVKVAWEHCYRATGEAQYHMGFVQELDNYSGYPKTVEGKFFSEMVRLGSCKGMFFGHDHYNTLSVSYQGIRLTYGMSVDYLAYPKIKNRHTQRGGTIIEIREDATFSVELLPLDDLQ